MKQASIILFCVVAFVACKKYKPFSPPGQPTTMAGKWNIASVTVIPLDSNGIAINNGTVYPEPSFYYFKFNSNGTWTETLTNDPASSLGEAGTYELHGDTTFTLTNTNAPSQSVECRIIALTGSAFEFSNQRPTLFNGITPGYLKYLFQLKR